MLAESPSGFAVPGNGIDPCGNDGFAAVWESEVEIAQQLRDHGRSLQARREELRREARELRTRGQSVRDNVPIRSRLIALVNTTAAMRRSSLALCQRREVAIAVALLERDTAIAALHRTHRCVHDVVSTLTSAPSEPDRVESEGVSVTPAADGSDASFRHIEGSGSTNGLTTHLASHGVADSVESPRHR